MDTHQDVSEVCCYNKHCKQLAYIEKRFALDHGFRSVRPAGPLGFGPCLHIMSSIFGKTNHSPQDRRFENGKRGRGQCPTIANETFPVTQQCLTRTYFLSFLVLGEDQALATLGHVSKLYRIPLIQCEIPHWESGLAIAVRSKTMLGR